MRLFLSFIVLLVLAKPAHGQNSNEIEQLLKKLNSTRDTAKINALNTLAWAVKQSEPKKALSYANEALTQSISLEYKNGQAKANKNLSVVNWSLGNYNAALKYSKTALNLFSELEDQSEIGNIHNIAGTIYYNKSNYTLAEESYLKALYVFKKINDADGIAKSTSNLGIIYREKGNLAKAIEYFIYALKIKEKQNDLSTIANILTNIGVIYLQQKNYPQALSYYTKCKKINLQIGNKTGIANAYANIAAYYFQTDNLDSALANNLIALNYYEEVANKNGISATYDNLGKIYNSQGKRQEALDFFKKALQIRQESNDKKGELITLYNLANFYRSDKEYDKALVYYNSALSIAKEIQSKHHISGVNYELSNTYAILNDYPNAYTYYVQYSEYKDSIFNKESNDKLLALEAEHEADKKEKEITLLNKEMQLKESRSKLLYAGIGSLILISSLIIILLVLKNRENKTTMQAELERGELQKKILENEIQTKEKEAKLHKNTLSVYTNSLLEKNTLLEELSQKLKELEIERPEDYNKIEKISQLTSARIITEDDWEQFKKLFENVYRGFFFKLKNEYPGITSAELRLAALIKLNLSSKEISSIIGVSNESVKKTRHRLRKKMQLNDEAGLDETIYNM